MSAEDFTIKFLQESKIKSHKTETVATAKNKISELKMPLGISLSSIEIQENENTILQILPCTVWQHKGNIVIHRKNKEEENNSGDELNLSESFDTIVLLVQRWPYGDKYKKETRIFVLRDHQQKSPTPSNFTFILIPGHYDRHIFVMLYHHSQNFPISILLMSLLYIHSPYPRL